MITPKYSNLIKRPYQKFMQLKLFGTELWVCGNNCFEKIDWVLQTKFTEKKIGIDQMNAFKLQSEDI